MQTPEDCVTSIRDELSKPTIKDWLGTNTRLRVERLGSSRDWRNHLPSTGVKLEGGLLRDDTGNHFFLSLQRKGWGFQPSPNTPFFGKTQDQFKVEFFNQVMVLKNLLPFAPQMYQLLWPLRLIAAVFVGDHHLMMYSVSDQTAHSR